MKLDEAAIDQIMLQWGVLSDERPAVALYISELRQRLATVVDAALLVLQDIVDAEVVDDGWDVVDLERNAKLTELLRRAMADPMEITSHRYAPYELQPGEVRGEFTADIDTSKPHQAGCLRCEVEALIGYTPNASERYRRSYEQAGT